MRTLTREQWQQLSPQQRAIRGHQLRAVVRRYELEHRMRYRGPEGLRLELVRATQILHETDQPRDARGRFTTTTHHHPKGKTA